MLSTSNRYQDLAQNTCMIDGASLAPHLNMTCSTVVCVLGSWNLSSVNHNILLKDKHKHSHTHTHTWDTHTHTYTHIMHGDTPSHTTTVATARMQTLRG